MAKKINIEKTILYEKYIIEEKSTIIIAKELNYSVNKINKSLKEYGLLRNRSEAQIIKCDRDGQVNQFELDVNQLKDMYLIQKLTSYDIAEKLACSQYKVWKTLNSLGISRSISETTKGRESWNKGKKGLQFHSNETKRKIRKATLHRIKTVKLRGGQLYPAYNSNSIKFIEEYGNNNGYKFQHAENGGEYYIEELGYWVDGYDASKNVVIEFDETHHNKQKEKDNNRQLEIITHLKCGFIRLNEKGEEILKTI